MVLKDKGHNFRKGFCISERSRQTQGFPSGATVKNLPAKAGNKDLIPGSGRSLEKEMATHSTILAWKIPRREEPGEPQSMGFKELDTTEHTRATQIYKGC